NRDYTESFTFFNKVRVILERHPSIMEDLSKRYVLTLSHLLRCYIDSGDYANASNLAQEIRSLEGKKGFESMDLIVRIFSVSNSFELIINNMTGNFSKSIQSLPSLQVKLDLFEDKLNKEQ